MMEVSSDIFRQILRVIHPFKTTDKIRMGRNFDGGYVVSKQVLDQSNVIISLGINNEWSFEQACLDYKSPDLLVMIDDQMSKSTLKRHVMRNFLTCLYRPLDREIRDNFFRVLNTLKSFKRLELKCRVIYDRLRIGSNQGEVDLSELLLKYKLKTRYDLFLKIDIEGSEYQVVNTLIKFEKQIVGLVIEFHDILKNPETFLKTIKSLNDHFIVYHVHYNNYTERNEYIADAIEISFINKSRSDLNCYDESKLPLEGLDFPCDNSKNDYIIYN